MTSQMVLEDGLKGLEDQAASTEITVTIPYEEYTALCLDRHTLRSLKAIGVLEDDNSLGLFAHDPEVALFLAARYGLMTENEAIRAVCSCFGMDRQPAMSQVKRFWLRFRQVLSLDCF